MNVSEKFLRAKEAIRSISTHDDADIVHVENTLSGLTSFVSTEISALRDRRAKKHAAEHAKAVADAAKKNEVGE